MLDSRAIIDSSAELGKNVSVGPWSTIGPGVVVGDDCHIGSHVILKGPTQIGRANKIYQFSSIGEDTPAIAYDGEPTSLLIGDNNIFREGVTVHRGMVQGGGITKIGSDCLFMAYVHIAHDCLVGNGVIMANNASLSGHVVVGDYANFGGYAAVPQYRQVGAYAHIAGLSLVLKNVPAFVTVAGNPCSAIGINAEGIRRRDFSEKVIEALNNAYKIVYLRGLLLADAVQELQKVVDEYSEIALFADSLITDKYGIVRPRKSSDDTKDKENNS
ncbi:MAG: acyl-[acyl-carrier-protein]--UDP-N-acetylglucosamine O-acyltransferase [Gammaproteobacteria bacterium]|nr:acyl-[acyl-carrier-protein]--UDP-N-acetylglucosamine O-acyltransferase [Gammaproteobacteria bacterium]